MLSTQHSLESRAPRSRGYETESKLSQYLIVALTNAIDNFTYTEPLLQAGQILLDLRENYWHYVNGLYKYLRRFGYVGK